jgi:hypothetical protein
MVIACCKRLSELGDAPTIGGSDLSCRCRRVQQLADRASDPSWLYTYRAGWLSI